MDSLTRDPEMELLNMEEVIYKALDQWQRNTMVMSLLLVLISRQNFYHEHDECCLTGLSFKWRHCFQIPEILGILEKLFRSNNIKIHTKISF